MLENCPAAAWIQQDILQALFPTPTPSPNPGPRVHSQSPKGSIAHACLWMETSSAASVQQQNLPANSQSRLMSKLTHAWCISAKSLSSFHSQPYSSTVRMMTAHQAKVAEQTQIFVAQDINFLPVLLSGNHPITTMKPESFAHKDASKSSVLSYSLGKWLPAFSDNKLSCELLIHPLPYHFLPCPSEHFKYT